jgi:hypothetical protein
MTEDEITAQIQVWQAAASEQRFEVAAKFAGEARSHLRNGKLELAERKKAAADFIALNGGVAASGGEL